MTKRGDAPVKPLNFVTENSIRVWLPGSHKADLSIRIPGAAQPGEYDLAVAIVDPTTQTAAIRLAIAGRDGEGWYPVSRVEVSR